MQKLIVIKYRVLIKRKVNLFDLIKALFNSDALLKLGKLTNKQFLLSKAFLLKIMMLFGLALNILFGNSKTPKTLLPEAFK